ncbi:hypothetical protein Aab01nite_01650 [Paractinoplanes abujensis]|uniref:Uncharacterized protein n=1 Tax=Paractinoplanes abujensis TaxID=882441 RepID=A0A7W7CNW4_9ACTN|nr:hypothetical protein [Actinoplanes abujensis]MBB4692009.1 hypothetical protein [Actinoplanes abujensis]GID16575.1 hypothetical protein Aab01nite_01650 [Actinoplanes abujensis]
MLVSPCSTSTSAPWNANAVSGSCPIHGPSPASTDVQSSRQLSRPAQQPGTTTDPVAVSSSRTPPQAISLSAEKSSTDANSATSPSVQPPVSGIHDHDGSDATGHGGGVAGSAYGTSMTGCIRSTDVPFL